MAKIRKANFAPFESRNLNGRYARITMDMTKSAAWQSLDLYARYLYFEFKLKYKPGQERNISLTYEEGMATMSKAKFTQARDKLIEAGFIDIVDHKPYGAVCTIYGLSDRWHDYGTDKFRTAQRPKSRRKANDEKHFPKVKYDHQKAIL